MEPMSANATIVPPSGARAADPTAFEAADTKVERLNTASMKRVLEPEEMFDWSSLGDGQIIPDELLSTTPLGVELSPDERARLSREEVAALLSAGVRFEAVLMAGFGLWVARAGTVTDPRIVYALHEVGEETRHSRAFIALIEATGASARNPLDRGLPALVRDRVIRSMLHRPALLTVFVLAGEEIPDLLQKRASEHPDTDPLVAAVNRYHRQEEARHLAFARTLLPELAERAGWVERHRIRHQAPVGIRLLFDSMLNPGIYRSVGLPGFRTWKRANQSERRLALRREATRPVLQQVIDAGFVKAHRVPLGWQRLCGVDRHNRPVADPLA